MALWPAIVPPGNAAEPAGGQDDICRRRCHKRAVGKSGPAPCRVAPAFLTCEGIPVGEARLTVPIIRQILTLRRGTKRWSDARTRVNSGCRKCAHNVARLAEVAADEPGEEGDVGERIEDDDSDDGDDDDKDDRDVDKCEGDGGDGDRTTEKVMTETSRRGHR